jgi:hypothetical protein
MSRVNALSTGLARRAHDPLQFRTPRRALVAHIASLLLRTVGGDFAQPIDQLAIASVLFDQAGNRIATLSPAPVAGDAQHVELDDQIAEGDGAVAGHRCGRLRWSEIDQEAN